MRRALFLGVLAALVLCPVAAAHGGGGALGFRSTVTRVTPAVTGLTVDVLDSDDRLEIRNDTGKPLIVLGYQGEPYLAFRNGHVYRNANSPATYLNDDRFGQIALPDQADPKATPEWKEVAPRERYDWHDHRIHWMSRTLPPKVQAAKGVPHHVFDWKVPTRLAGQRTTIAGSLDYRPPPDQEFNKVLIVPMALLVLSGGAAVWLKRRRTKAG